MAVLAILAAVTGIVTAVRAQEGKCCNWPQTDCQGCQAILDRYKKVSYYVLLPNSNPTYRCQDYTNPLTCSEGTSNCYSGPALVYLAVDGAVDCSNQGIAQLGTANFSVIQCSYDSCD